MKVLQLCLKPPIPMVDGGCIAMHALSQGLLSKGVDLKILTISTSKHPLVLDQILRDFKEKTQIEGIFLDTSVNVIGAFLALVTSGSYNVSRYFSTDFDRRLINLLQENQYDVVHLESLYMTPYVSTIRRWSSAKIILRSHNLEHLIWEQLASTTANIAKRMYLKHLASKLKKYEKRIINEVDGIAAISAKDTARFKAFECKKPLATIPFGIDLTKHKYVQKTTSKRNKFFHIGSMNWEPNKEGINWFVCSIWPLIKEQDISFHLAGRKMPQYLTDLNSDKFIVHGEVDSAVDFMQENDIMIVPLLSGGGIRIKIIEAMASGKTVISTKVGAEGIACTHNENIVIANSAQEIADAVVGLAADPNKALRLGTNARKLIETEYNANRIIENLIAFYNS